MVDRQRTAASRAALAGERGEAATGEDAAGGIRGAGLPIAAARLNPALAGEWCSSGFAKRRLTHLLLRWNGDEVRDLPDVPEGAAHHPPPVTVRRIGRGLECDRASRERSPV